MTGTIDVLHTQPEENPGRNEFLRSTDLAGKRLEILREILPGLRTLAILTDTGSSNSALENLGPQLPRNP
jgi:hypothetical protein